MAGFETPDGALVERFQTGDETAFDDLYRRYRRQLRHACRAAGDDAEDVVQETFVLVWRALERLPPDVRIYAYAYVVARRLVRTNAAQRALVEPVADVDDVGETVPTELDGTVQEAVAELPAAQREALAYHVVEGLSRQATAARLGVAPRQVDALVGRALLALRERLR